MDFRNIVASVDVKDDLARAVVIAAEGMARKHDAALHLVTVWPMLASAAPPYAADLAPTSVAVSEAAIEQDKKARASAEKRLKEMSRELAPDAQVHIFDGEPADVVADIAKKTGADVIVAGTHQKGFWGSLLSGAPSRDLVHDAPCAVFLVTKPFAEKLLAAAN